MQEAFIATLIFWGAFMFSPGPWWITFMEAAKDTPLRVLYRNMLIHVTFWWMPFCFSLSFVTATIGGVHPFVLHFLHFAGGAMMLYYALRVLAAKMGKGKKINYNWRAMMLVSVANPKSWATIPAGSLAATYTDSLAINSLLFVLVSVVLYFPTAYGWYVLGRGGAKLAHDKLSYVNASLLASFAFYLFWRGFVNLAN